MKTCPKCKLSLTEEDFYPSLYRIQNARGVCKTCRDKATREYRKKSGKGNGKRWGSLLFGTQEVKKILDMPG